ncbi:hypothetical protein JR552_001783 [Listeria monocytogenes serotype 1/2b]|uniref:Uncharacterized protein n=1 Tax=Listeria seeligeri TaxID=1640 RepID=A0A7X1C6J9_LISSE|nr:MULTISPECIES: hypothetical protein [Listeria]EHC6275925.1 hypothetical protein [Listeria monocytogenes serotype 1/2b]EAC2511284.1 hypothetical protein [Listeria monocytogenes]EAE2754057.1 hypothetical protein [Listeria monocytogenes]EAG2021201.1 hypothetical protein [Listeria monocytogenes]ECP2270511.1 hypothetical protein [Listeria monocytogenes]
MKKCESCGEIFKKFDNIVFVNEQDYFHKSCVVLVPVEYAVFAKPKGGDFLGMCSDDDLDCPLLMLEEGEYLKEGEDKE